MWMFSVAAVATVSSIPTFADEASCKPFIDASAKTSKTPFHSHSVQTMPGIVKSNPGAAKMLGMDKPTIVESYNTGEKTYMYTPKDGKWSSMPSSMFQDADVLAEQRENLKKTDCSVLRSEPVDGEVASVFQAVNAAEGNKTVAWISPAGLLLRLDLTVSSGSEIKSTFSATYDYKDVQLPPGAK
jgi:outer membrane lipoprotein-sorting protein